MIGNHLNMQFHVHWTIQSNTCLFIQQFHVHWTIQSNTCLFIQQFHVHWTIQSKSLIDSKLIK